MPEKSFIPNDSDDSLAAPLRRVQEVRQLEDVTGITLLATRPDGTVTLTPDGEQFARSVRPVPNRSPGRLLRTMNATTAHKCSTT
jgi:hypothetical protein